MLAAPNNNLTVVGDDDQSIYKFRGASVSNILQFKNDFLEAEEIIISDNYRSKQKILDYAYNFIKQNDPNRLEAKLGISKKLQARREGEGIVEHLHAKTSGEEAIVVVEKIAELKRVDDKLKWNDFAVLVRANSQADIFMQSFDRNGVPYQFLASAGLYSKPIILDVISYLKILDNYHESSAVYRVLNMAVVDLDYSDIVKINYFARRKNWSLFETMKNAPAVGVSAESLRKINKILSFIEKHTSLTREKGLGKAVYNFLEDFNILKDLSQRAEKGELKAVENIGFINQFLKKIDDFERTNADKSIKNFMTELDMAIESGEEGALSSNFDEGPETVKILTVHGAKGLEFKYVFIVNLVDLRFPSTDRKDPIELPRELVKEILPEGDIHLEEERRLFYVALTRGRDGVFLTSASDYGGQRKKKISRFLAELGFVEPKIAFLSKEEIKRDNKEEEAKHKFKYWLPSRFSFTQLKAFETCPLQYKFAHILAVPVRGKFIFSFGKSMHSTLQKFFERMSGNNALCQKSLFGSEENASCLSLRDLLKIYEESWIDDWYDNKSHEEEYKKQGRESLQEFYKINSENWPKVKYLERGFNLKIGDYAMRGVIDRVDEGKDGSIEILDYKTGSVPQDEKYLEKDQLLIYQLAANRVFGEKVTKLSYYYLTENKVISFLGTEDDLEKIEQKIIKTIEEIRQSDFSPKPSLFNCKNCDFKDICEHRVI
jgi:DNA helicase-2/ATP-dependent DNA helicase PcrA